MSSYIDFLSPTQKKIIKDIVKFYTNSTTNIKTDPLRNPPVIGMYLSDCFSEDSHFVQPYQINGELYLKISIKDDKELSENLLAQTHSDLNKTIFIQMHVLERITLIKKLLEDNLIFFIGNLDSQMPEYKFIKDDLETNLNLHSLIQPLGSEDSFKFLSKYYMA